MHVLNVESNQLLAYPLRAEDSMAHLQKCLELETKIPVAAQDLLLASGIAPDLHNPALQCWTEPVSITPLPHLWHCRQPLQLFLAVPN